MNNKHQKLATFISAVILLLLITDTKTAATGAADGIELCLKVIIPSLFPFFLVTTYMNVLLAGMVVPGLDFLGKKLHIPSGGESLLLLGLIGGYPVGAQMIGDAYRQKKLDKQTGEILLGYCNNAGPAFIFGVASTLFTSKFLPLLLWLIHILSALITGFILPKPTQCKMNMAEHTPITISESVHKSITVCVSVCGWIIVFKIILAYISCYLSQCCSNAFMIMISGILELSNGCIRLTEFDFMSMRFILCSVFLALGGLCVALQTQSVTSALKWGLYFPGKIMQSCISLLLTIPCVYFLFPNDRFSFKISLCIFSCCILIIVLLKHITEKNVEIQIKIIYNAINVTSGGYTMLFRKKTPRSCTTCLYAADLSNHQLLCAKRGIVTDSYACRKYRYDPCKRIPPVMKAPDFKKFKDEDFSLD